MTANQYGLSEINFYQSNVSLKIVDLNTGEDQCIDLLDTGKLNSLFGQFCREKDVQAIQQLQAAYKK